MLLLFIFPGVVSTLLLIAGILTVMAGAVVYTDPIIASKWLPGRMSPVHVLIVGVSTLLLGVILGIIAK